MILKLFTAATLALSIGFSGASSAATIGTLTWDGVNDVITDSASDTTYLQLGLLAHLNYAQTLAQIADGAAYEDYHIASQEEAYGFYNAMATGHVVDVGGSQVFSEQVTAFDDGALGDNFHGDADLAFFLSDEGEEVGLVTIGTNILSGLSIQDSWSLVHISNTYTGQFFDNTSASWLLVADTEISPVPIPTAAFLFAPALLGFLGFRRKIRA